MNYKLRKQLMIGALALSMVSGNVMPVLADAAPDGKTDAAVMAEEMGMSKQWNSWKKEWNTVKKDWTQISLTPGEDASKLNAAWYTKQSKKAAAPKFIIGKGKSMKNAKVYEAEQTVVENETDADGNTYYSNKVTITGLKENTTYYYKYQNGNGYTKPAVYKTKSSKNFSFVFVGDPQIGSSNELKGTDSEEFYSAQSDAVRSDAFNWETTLNAAMKKTNNKASFVVSAGDQIQTTKKKSPNKDAAKSEIEYSGYLSPDILKSLPVATTVGNHDADNANYTYHFNTPNQSELGSNGIVGGDYSFKYGDVLFMMLNTQDTNVAEHKQFIEQAVAENKDCKWRIVTLHQDIYGSAEHSNEPEITNLRYELTPFFEENDVDAVLTGHDHAYTRSKMMLGGTQSELAASYTDDEFDEQLDIDMDAGEDPMTLLVAPGNIADDTTDPAGQKYLAYLKSVMDEAAVEDVKQAGNSVVNPEGILYMTASSSSGSKYYDLVPRKQTYVANRWQEDVPTYSVVDVKGNKLTINTYRTDTNEKIDDTFSIIKNKAQKKNVK
jgi:predicted phosphodiesterase